MRELTFTQRLYKHFLWNEFSWLPLLVSEQLGFDLFSENAECAAAGALASIYDKYSIGPSIRPICMRLCSSMTRMIQVWSNFHWARVLVINHVRMRFDLFPEDAERAAARALVAESLDWVDHLFPDFIWEGNWIETLLVMKSTTRIL